MKTFGEQPNTNSRVNYNNAFEGDNSQESEVSSL